MSEFDAPQSRVEALLQNLLGADNPYGAPQSRIEAILQNMLGANNVLLPPESRNEELLLEILQQGGGGKPTQTKTATPTEQEQTILPDEGYLLSEVTVEPIPSQYIVPSGELNVTENVSGVDIKQYASLNVAVPVPVMPEEYAIGGSLVDKTLTKYHYPQNATATKLENGFFKGCINLKTIENFPQNLTELAPNLFYDCYELETVDLPNTITLLNNGCFQHCYKFDISSLPQSLTTIGISDFNQCYALTLKSLPVGVTLIRASAFSECTSLTEMTFFGNITQLEGAAFWKCSACLKYDFTHNSIIPRLDNIVVFADMNANCKIVVPDSLYNDWIIATNWINFDTHIVKESEYNA